VLPYFAYGVVYFIFLFVDRVLAWSSHDIYMPYVVWFRGEYELGMDYAMAALVFPLGVVEDVIRRYSEGLVISQKSYSAARSKVFDELYLKQYTKNLISYAAMSWVSGLIVWAIIDLIYVNRWFADTFYTSAVTMFVFRWGIVGYCSLVLFSLSVPNPVLNAAAVALIVDIGVGFVLSRLVSYTWAVFGFVIGAAVFALLTTRAVRRVLRNLDFYLYAAS
jgi:hypothetical protein